MNPPSSLLVKITLSSVGIMEETHRKSKYIIVSNLVISFIVRDIVITTDEEIEKGVQPTCNTIQII